MAVARRQPHADVPSQGRGVRPASPEHQLLLQRIRVGVAPVGDIEQGLRVAPLRHEDLGRVIVRCVLWLQSTLVTYRDIQPRLCIPPR